jgi:hypothetical protein
MGCRSSRLALVVLGCSVATGRPSRAEDWTLYWGDVHGHTALSDGRGSVEEYFAHAREAAGLDFATVTDHDFGHAEPWRMAAEDWRRTQDFADASTEDGRFVAVAGCEWTSQPKYWSEPGPGLVAEGLFPGPARHFGHACVYFPHRVGAVVSSKDEAGMSLDRLAAAVSRLGGLAHHAHPTLGPVGRDRFDRSPESARVLANVEMLPNVVRHEGRRFRIGSQRVVRDFLRRGGRVGFVGGSDTHEGRPDARTAVLASEPSREGIFEALRARRCYAVTRAHSPRRPRRRAPHGRGGPQRGPAAACRRRAGNRPPAAGGRPARRPRHALLPAALELLPLGACRPLLRALGAA